MLVVFRRALPRQALLALVLLAATLPLVPATAAPPLPTNPGTLSVRLAQLAQPGATLQSTEALARALSVAPQGAGSLLRDSQGRLLVSIRVADTGAANLAALRVAGAEITDVAPAYRAVTALVAPAQLQALASLAVVEHVREELQPGSAGGLAQPASSHTRLAPGTQATCPSGVVSEGDQQVRAAQARATYGVNGSGQTVGVISTSYNTASRATDAADDIASGDLPGFGNPCGFTTPVNVLQDTPIDNSRADADEGRAMLQIVHDLAPGARLAYATAFGGIFNFANNVRRLHNQAGATVIVDDIYYYFDPFFQDGPVSVAIQEVAAQGTNYVTLAGNNHRVDSSDAPFGSYEAPSYRPTACPAAVAARGMVDCHNFATGGAPDATSGYLLGPGGQLAVILQWAEPWFGVTTDLNLFLVSASGTLLASSSDVNPGQNGSQVPGESIFYAAGGGRESVALVIGRRQSAAPGEPRLKYILFQSSFSVGFPEYVAANSSDTFGPALYGHSDSLWALSVAAVPYYNATTPQGFTSHGPAAKYFGPVVDANPAAALARPDVRNKPDLAATNGGKNTFFGEFDGAFYRFYGTSAAAPHAAAVSALLRQRASQRNLPFGAADVVTLMKRTTAPMAGGSPQANGTGLVDALAAMQRLETLQIRQRFIPLIRR